MLIKLATRQSLRQIKTNIFHLLTLVVIFTITFVMVSFSSDKTLTDNLTGAIASAALDKIGGMSTVFTFFLYLIMAINIFFLAYIFRLRMHQNAKTYALYRLLGLRTKDLFVLYLFEVIVLIVITALIGGVLGIGVIRVSKIFLISLGNFVESKVEFSFSLSSYLTSIILYSIVMFIAMLISFITVVRTDIILLFKRDQLVQKTSKLTPVYFVLGLGLLFFALPHFAKLGTTQDEFFKNFLMSTLISVLSMYFLYRSFISILFGIRRRFGLHKRHSSEFITGRFFFSQLNKSSMMMTIVSVFLIISFIFTFLSSLLLNAVDLNKLYATDFSMMNATEKDKSEVKTWLSDHHVKTYTTDFEYTLFTFNSETETLLTPQEIQHKITDAKNLQGNDYPITAYFNYIVISEDTYQKNIEQMKRAGREVPKPIEKLYNAQNGAEIKQILGQPMDASEIKRIKIDPDANKKFPQNLNDEEKSLMTRVTMIDRPVSGEGYEASTLDTTTPVFVASEKKYEEFKKIGIQYAVTAFNTPNITPRQYRDLSTNTALGKYVLHTSINKQDVLLVNIEVQSPIRFSFMVLLVQVLFYIVVLILYRLNEMIQKQYRIFETLHIVGASNFSIFGSVFFQTVITLILPVFLSFYIAWVAVSNVFNAIYSYDRLWSDLTLYFPHIISIFIVLTIGFTLYHSFEIRKRQIN